MVPFGLQGARTYWYGWGCPFHCREPGWSLLALTFIISPIFWTLPGHPLTLDCLITPQPTFLLCRFRASFLAFLFPTSSLSSRWVRGCFQVPTAKVRWNWFARWGNLGSLFVDLRLRPYICCSKSWVLVVVILVLYLLVTLRDLLTWCLRGVFLLSQLLCLYPVKKRGLRLRPLLTSAPGDSLTLHQGFRALPSQERKE